MSNNPQPSLREKLIPVFMKFGSKFAPFEQPETVNFVTDEAIDAIMQLFESTMLEVIKVPPCNCKHARHIVGEQRTRLSALLGKGGKQP